MLALILTAIFFIVTGRIVRKLWSADLNFYRILKITMLSWPALDSTKKLLLTFSRLMNGITRKLLTGLKKPASSWLILLPGPLLMLIILHLTMPIIFPQKRFIREF